MISSVTHPTTSTESCCGIDRNPSASRNIFLFDLRNSIFGVDFSGIERQYLTLPNMHLPRPTGELTEAFWRGCFSETSRLAASLLCTCSQPADQELIGSHIMGVEG
jgi:hypothetical protein